MPADAMAPRAGGAVWSDAWFVDGVRRTSFVDYTQAFSPVSPIDLSIRAMRAILQRRRQPPEEIGTVICGSVALANFDTYVLPRELGLDDKVDVNGGAIAIGHPLGATSIRLVVALSRESKRAGARYGIAPAFIGERGIALLIENPAAGKVQ